MPIAAKVGDQGSQHDGYPAHLRTIANANAQTAALLSVKPCVVAITMNDVPEFHFHSCDPIRCSELLTGLPSWKFFISLIL